MYNKSYAIWHFANRLSVLTDSEIKRTWLFFRQHLSHLEEVNLSTTSIFKGYAKYKVSDLITKMMPSGGTMSRWVHYIKSTYRVHKSKRFFEKHIWNCPLMKNPQFLGYQAQTLASLPIHEMRLTYWPSFMIIGKNLWLFHQ